MTEAAAAAVDNMQLGLVLLNERGMVLDMNCAARDALRSSDAFRIRNGKIAYVAPSENRKLWLVIKRVIRSDVGGAGGDAVVTVARDTGLPYASVRIRRIAVRGPADEEVPRRVVIYIRRFDENGAVSEHDLRELFGFTRTEASVARELANGCSLNEAAMRIGIRRSTARTHLRSIFQKVGVKRQSALVRAILTSVIAVK